MEDNIKQFKKIKVEFNPLSAISMLGTPSLPGTESPEERLLLGKLVRKWCDTVDNGLVGRRKAAV
jgi:hypothetical protein